MAFAPSCCLNRGHFFCTNIFPGQIRGARVVYNLIEIVQLVSFLSPTHRQPVTIHHLMVSPKSCAHLFVSTFSSSVGLGFHLTYIFWLIINPKNNVRLQFMILLYEILACRAENRIVKLP